MMSRIKYVSFRAAYCYKTIKCYIKLLKHRHLTMRGALVSLYLNYAEHWDLLTFQYADEGHSKRTTDEIRQIMDNVDLTKVREMKGAIEVVQRLSLVSDEPKNSAGTTSSSGPTREYISLISSAGCNFQPEVCSNLSLSDNYWEPQMLTATSTFFFTVSQRKFF